MGKEMKLFKMAAKAKGYEMWYDRSLKSYVLTKEGIDTEYFDPYILTHMGLAKFMQVYLQA